MIAIIVGRIQPRLLYYKFGNERVRSSICHILVLIIEVIEVDCGRNYYNCRRSEHLERHCKNWKIIKEEIRN